MSNFEIFAHGESFVPNDYLSSTKLKIDRIWHKGEAGHYHPKSSGVAIHLGNGYELNVIEQELIAINYLTKYNDELKELGYYSGVSTFILGLQYHLKIDESITGFCMGPTKELMECALRVGIVPTFYVTLEHECEYEIE
jgi:hypothetical protein